MDVFSNLMFKKFFKLFFIWKLCIILQNKYGLKILISSLYQYLFNDWIGFEMIEQYSKYIYLILGILCILLYRKMKKKNKDE